MDERAQKILDFWFGKPGDAEYGQIRPMWFKGDAAIDGAIRSQFLDDYVLARDGALDSWRNEPQSCLALVILLDQFPRNMFRDSARSFAADSKALAITNAAIERGIDKDLPLFQRVFFSLPFQHSEDIAMQERGLAVTKDMETYGEFYAYAAKHRDVIKRFGRFPHRNALLGRINTLEEEGYLAELGGKSPF